MHIRPSHTEKALLAFAIVAMVLAATRDPIAVVLCAGIALGGLASVVLAVQERRGRKDGEGGDA